MSVYARSPRRRLLLLGCLPCCPPARLTRIFPIGLAPHLRHPVRLTGSSKTRTRTASNYLRGLLDRVHPNSSPRFSCRRVFGVRTRRCCALLLAAVLFYPECSKTSSVRPASISSAAVRPD
jgi:hypothetical protein